MIEIRLDPDSMEEDDDWEEPLYSVFAEGRKVFSFQGESVRYILNSPVVLAQDGDRIHIGWKANEGDNWLDRAGGNVIVSRGEVGYFASGEENDRRERLAEFAYQEWVAAVARFAAQSNA